MKENIETFEDVLHIVGDNGSFQKRFNIIFNLIGAFLLTMPYLNMILALLVPEHWCNVPGRDLTNLTAEEWKILTLPVENSSGQTTYSSCTMYNISDIAAATDLKDKDIVGCQYGWTYNQEWYSSTIPTDQNWVCDNSLRVANTYTFIRIGEICGNVIAGIFTDVLGRKPMFYVALFSLIVGRLSVIVTPSMYVLFLLATALSSTSTTSMFQSPMIVTIEISNPDTRAQPAILQVIGWTAAIGLLPCVMWLTGNWISYVLLTTLPVIVYFAVVARYMIESPRWLLNRGKITRCIKELKTIAKVNKTTLPEDIYNVLDSLPKDVQRSMGFFGLFSHWRVAKNTLCTAFCYGAFQASYYIIMFNVGNLDGNPLVNFFLQSIVELPGYLLAKPAADYLGRKWTHIIAFAVSGLSCLPLIVLNHDPNYQWLGRAVPVFLKFSLSIAYYAINLQSYELYPTCLRQTGLSFCGISANAFGILGPYIVYLGTSLDASFPYVILTAFTFVSVVCGFMLPETLHHKLPDTLMESQVFGKQQHYWSLPKRDQGFEPVKT